MNKISEVNITVTLKKKSSFKYKDAFSQFLNTSEPYPSNQNDTNNLADFDYKLAVACPGRIVIWKTNSTQLMLSHLDKSYSQE